MKVPRFPLPVFDPTVTVADPLPVKLAGETERVRGFPEPDVEAEIAWEPVAFARENVTVPERKVLTL